MEKKKWLQAVWQDFLIYRLASDIHQKENPWYVKEKVQNSELVTVGLLFTVLYSS